MSVLPTAPVSGSVFEDDMAKLLHFRAASGEAVSSRVTALVQEYIDGLPSPHSRRRVAYSLDTAASLLGGSAWQLYPWHMLDTTRFKMLRVSLMEKVDRDEYVRELPSPKGLGLPGSARRASCQ